MFCRSIKYAYLIAVIFVGCFSSLASGQEKQINTTAVDPINCWWKSDKAAVRVGEHFNLTLTCQVVETEEEKVVIDRSAIEPNAVSLVPYEVVSGKTFDDIISGYYRFFQYQYVIRIFEEDIFGKEVPIPQLEISYAIQRKADSGQDVSGYDQRYSLPLYTIKINSLVPKNAKDIKDDVRGSFDDVERYNLHARISYITAISFGIIGFLIAIRSLLLTWRLFRSRSGAVPLSGIVKTKTIIGYLIRELKLIRQEKLNSGWSEDLLIRMMTVVNIGGSIALGQPVIYKKVDVEVHDLEGQLKLIRGFFRPKKILVSSPLTVEKMSLLVKDKEAMSYTQGYRRLLQSMVEASVLLRQFRYGRDGFPEENDTKKLDESLKLLCVYISGLADFYSWPALKMADMSKRLRTWRRRTAWSH